MIEREKIQNRRNLILQHAERIYGLLWREMNRWIEEGQERGLKIETNGSPFDKCVIVPNSKSRTLTLSLNKERHAISVSGLKAPLELLLNVCPDNTVCLKYEGAEIDIDKAAVLILDPFLFPEFVA